VIASNCSVHETAIIEEGAVIGLGTSVWHHAHVRSGAVIGRRCNLGKNVYIDGDVRMGDGVKVQNNVSIFAGVSVEDEVFLGPGVTFTNDRFPRAASVDWEVVPTVVRRGASIGANATVVCGVEIGEWAMVGAGTVVTHDVESHEVVVGNPAHRIGWACRCGRVAATAVGRPIDLRCVICAGGGRP